MDIIETTQSSLSSLANSASDLRSRVPREFVFVSVGLFGVGIGLGALIGVLTHRALTETEAEANYEAWTKSNLYDLATQRDITGRGDMTKDELIDAIRAA